MLFNIKGSFVDCTIEDVTDRHTHYTRQALKPPTIAETAKGS